MDLEHQRLRKSLRQLAGTAAGGQDDGAYSGSPHPALRLAVPQLRQAARTWLAANKALPAEQVLDLADRLFASGILDEHVLAALMLGYSQRARRAATPPRVDRWLDGLVGWAEIDALCSNVFQADDFLADSAAWGAWLRGLAADPNINKRRASLVMLTGPARRSEDVRFLDLALANIADLRGEKAILITKAVSWLLRSLVTHHRAAVADYVEANRSILPAIAVREVCAKLETGRKVRRPGAR